MNKRNALLNLYQENKACLHCPFGKEEHEHRVFGDGNQDAALLLIGEAPGADEDRLKKPFVGRAGQLLNRLLRESGHTREEVYITNVVKCRPPGNRTPLPEEITPELKQLLKREIMIIQPRVICTLGAVATRLFFPQTSSISQLRGIPRRFSKENLLVLPTFHPAYALRNKDGEKLLLDDLKQAFQLACSMPNGNI